MWYDIYDKLDIYNGNNNDVNSKYYTNFLE